MRPSPHVSVAVDLRHVRANASAIATRTGVPVLAVVKADAYGLGVEAIAQAIADLVEGFCVFDVREAATARLWEQTGKPVRTLRTEAGVSAEQCAELHLRPAVSEPEQAQALRAARPVLCVDCGMQRFACPSDRINETLHAGACDEAFTHAIRREQAQQLVKLLGGRGVRLHAAGSALLDDAAARLDAVRPGLALYRGAVRVTTHLVEARDTTGPAGYTGIIAPRLGVIAAGYSNGLRAGPCLVNGRRASIVEVGMQSAFVQISAGDRISDEVVLLGEDLTETDVADAWGSSPQEALVQCTGLGRRQYIS